MRKTVLLLLLACVVLPLSASSQPVIIIDSLGGGLCSAVPEGDRVTQYISICNPDTTLRRLCFALRFYSPDGGQLQIHNPEEALTFYNDFLSLMYPDEWGYALIQDADAWILSVFTFPNCVAYGWSPSPDTVTYIGIEFTVQGEGSRVCIDSSLDSWGNDWLADPGPSPVFGGEVCHVIGPDVPSYCWTYLYSDLDLLVTPGYCEPISYYVHADRFCDWLPLIVDVVEGPGLADWELWDNYVHYSFQPTAADYGKTYNITIVPYDDWCRDGSHLIYGEPVSFTVTVGTEDALVGDLDLSGVVDISDLQELIYIMFIEPQEPADPRVCDADCSGGVDITDVSFLVDHLFLTLAPLCDGC